MAAVRLPRLSRPGVLESISPERLFALLQPHSAFFANRSLPIDSPDSIDCKAVIHAITHADRETPADLLDAICLIDELASDTAVDLLLNRVPGNSLGLDPGGKHSAADIITAAWLCEREQLIQTHARTKLKRARSFDYYQSNQTNPQNTSRRRNKLSRSWNRRSIHGSSNDTGAKEPKSKSSIMTMRWKSPSSMAASFGASPW